MKSFFYLFIFQKHLTSHAKYDINTINNVKGLVYRIMQKMEKRRVDMTQGPFLKKIILFAIPLILTGVLQQLYNAADLVVVGMFDGQIALAAVGATGSLTNLVVGLFMGLSVGAGVCVAHHIGEKKYEEVRKVIHTSLLLALFLGIVICLVGYVFAPNLLRLMDTPDNVIGHATTYIRIIFIGLPALMVYNYAAAMLRSAGDAKHPLIFLSVSGILNIVLNVILVAFFHMGVAGVAIATITAQYLSAILVLTYMSRTDSYMKFSPRCLKIHPNKVKKILYIGVPSGIQSCLFSFSNVLIQSSINSFGDTVMAGSAAASNLENFIYIAMNALYHVSLTFIGQNVGAKSYHNIKKITLYCISVVTVLGISLGGMLFLFREPLINLYAPNNPAVMAEAVRRMSIITFTYFLCGIMEVLCGAMRAMGKSITTMIISLCGACGLRILWIVTLFRAFKTPECVYLSYPVSWILTNLCYVIFFLFTVRALFRRQQNEMQLQEAV